MRVIAAAPASTRASRPPTSASRLVRTRANSRRAVVRGSISQVANAREVAAEDRPAPGAVGTPSSRRDFLAAQIIAACTATASLLPPSPAVALENADVPREYAAAARAVVKTLTKSLEFEATNPRDADRFREAEPAKEAVKAFIKDWAASPLVQGDRAHDDIVLAVRELGEFYKRNGSRAALSLEARESVLAKLRDAGENLPAAPPTLADRLLGL